MPHTTHSIIITPRIRPVPHKEIGPRSHRHAKGINETGDKCRKWNNAARQTQPAKKWTAPQWNRERFVETTQEQEMHGSASPTDRHDMKTETPPNNTPAEPPKLWKHDELQKGPMYECVCGDVHRLMWGANSRCRARARMTWLITESEQGK